MNSTILDETSLNISKTSQEDWGADLDPMLEGGAFRVAFNRQCPFEIRRINQQGNEYGTRQMLNLRIMVSPSLGNYTQIKIQISCQQDLYMVYQHRSDHKRFEKLKKLQSLNFNFQNFLSMLVKLLGYCDKYPDQYTSVLYVSKTGAHRLTILQNMQYKKLQLLALQFSSIDQQFNRQYLSFRFSILKAKNQKLQNTTKQMMGLVKLKNPNLLQFIAKKTNTSNLGVHNLMTNTNNTSNNNVGNSSLNIGYHRSNYR